MKGLFPNPSPRPPPRSGGGEKDCLLPLSASGRGPGGGAAEIVKGRSMAIEICVPRPGWNMEEGVFIAWHKKDGELVKAGEPLSVLEGDKATQDVEASDA